MEIRKLVLGELQTNCYFVINYNECVVIDPACEYLKILEFAKSNNVTIKAILLTHGHFDHVGAVKELQTLGLKVYVSEFDASVIEKNPKLYGIRREKNFSADVFVKDGDILNLIGLNFEVLKTSGHTEGSVCYKVGDVLFSGDTLFEGGMYGRCDLYSGNFNKIKDSILNVLFSLQDDTIVYPGHGDKTTIKKEKMLIRF